MQMLKTKAEFDKALASTSGLVVVHFSAEWCGSCRIMKPKVEYMALKYNNVAFYIVDVDVNSETAEKYGIKGLPTFKLYKNGTEVDSLTGAHESSLENKIKLNR